MSYLSYVNVRQGTRSSFRFSRGNTLPLTQLPFAMNAFAVQSQSNGENWFFNPDERTLEGIRLTHQPSPWIGDYTPIILQPQRGEFFQYPEARRSFFRPEAMVYSPAQLRVRFERYAAEFHLVPTLRGAKIKLRYDGQEPAALCLFCREGDTSLTLEPDGTLTGTTNHRIWPAAANFKMYFALRLSCPLDREKCILDETHPASPGAYIALTEREAEARVAVSFISREQAIRNLEQETCAPFEELLEAARNTWEAYLGKIQLAEDSPEDVKKTFYTCLYRVFLYPHRFYELDGEGRAIHYCADTGKVFPGVKYVDNGFWDTFRTVYPLLAILAPKEEREIIEGFVNTWRDCGWLPKWPAPAEVGMMPGTLFEAVLADAAVKGIIDGQLLADGIAGMLKEAAQESELPYGRHGTADYNRFGYIPRDKYQESVSHTLDYVYGDFCIAQALTAAGRGREAAPFEASAKNYRLLFDPDTGFMRGRDSQGKFAPDFDPIAWGGEYCEGGPWQSSFAVYHDYEGLAALYGGREGLIAKLDELFATAPDYHVGGYGAEIHEMAEAAALTDLGQCAMSNQPSFHIPWMYAELDQKEKTERWLQIICRDHFFSHEEGLPGDEDNGTMAAWYIFAMLGLYPTCPGRSRYIAVRPQVDAVLHLEGKDLPITRQDQRGKYWEYADIVK